MLRSITLVVLVAWCTSVVYAVACDETMIPSKIVDQRASHTPLDVAHTTLFGLQIGVADLDLVQAQLGKTQHLPRKESAPERLCYTGKSSSAPIVIFEAGAMGGWRYLTSFCVLSAAEGKALHKHCAVTNKIDASVGTDGGITLGMETLKVKTLLGEPTVVDKNKYSYWRLYQNDQKFDVTEYVGVTHAGGKVTGVRVSKVETN